MNTESARKKKLKRLKKGKPDLTKLTTVSRTTARKTRSVTSSKNKKTSQKTSEVQLPIEVKSQPDANYLQSVEERKRERKPKQAERFKRKIVLLEKKRELIESVNCLLSTDDKKDDILRVSTINAIDKSEVKKSDIPNVKDIESTAPKSELEKKVWDNIIKDLEDLDKDQVQDVCSEEISPDAINNVAMVNEMTEKETVQTMIMEFEEEEPSDWEDREPLEAEIVEEDEGDDADPEGLSEDRLVLLSSDDESNTDKEPKKLKEIPIDQNKVKPIGESTKGQNQKDLSVSPATEDVAHHTANAQIVDDSEVRFSDVSDSDSEGVLQLETEDDDSDTENMKDTAPVDESNPKELEGVGRIDSVSAKAVDTKDDKQEDNGGDDLLKNPEDTEEYKEFKVPTLPKLMTMHDLENVIRERMLNYVEECNKTIMDAQNERINELEKQLELWKKRATFLESQVKEAESELEIYKAQLSAQNKVTNTSLTPVKKSTTAPKTTSATPGPKSSATVIDLTEEEEDKSGNKNASVISSPNQTVALKPNVVKSESGAPSILQSPSMTINTIPVGGGGLSISLSRPRAMAQPTATRPKQAMTVTTKAPIPRKSKTHPAELPAQPNYPAMPSLKLLPPRPSLKISKVANGIVLSWNMKINATYADIISYQLYAYQETSVAPNPALWKKLGDVKALSLPMACTLTHFGEGNRYYFAVRAVDKHDRIGPFSEPTFIILHARR